jgi:hypothetical protein
MKYLKSANDVTVRPQDLQTARRKAKNAILSHGYNQLTMKCSEMVN